MKTQSRPKRATKKLTAIQTSRHFRMSHRRHSGHILPRQHTSYPVLIMIVLCVGVLLFSWTRAVTADTYDVHTRVPGPAPTIAATIDNPLDGTVMTDTPVTVTGRCPINTYVSLTRNNVFSGVGICEGAGTYSIKTDLFRGTNQLKAQVYSQTDLPGPASNIVTVTYSTKPLAVTQNVPANPLILKSEFKYQGVYSGESTTWHIEIAGGTAPYALSIDWGDGTTGVVSRAQAGGFSLEHIYKKAGAYKGSYTATFTASDAEGNTTYLQLLAIVNNPARGGVVGGNTSSGPALGNGTSAYLENIIRYVWPGYGITLLMLASFWLGERRELRYLQPKIKRSARRHA